MSTLWWDLRLAVRRLAARPLLTLAAILCGALGIGLCTTIFSAYYAMIVRPFPVADPEHIVSIVSHSPAQGVERSSLTQRGFEILTRLAPDSLDDITGLQELTLTFAGEGEPRRLSGAAVSANLFSLLRVQPAHGRALQPEDDRPGATGVVVLSHDFWTRHLGADPDTLDSIVRIDDRPHQVVGIMPPGFQYPTRQQAWIPLTPRLDPQDQDSRSIEVLARRSRDSDLVGVEHGLSTLATSLAANQPDRYADWQWRPLRLRDYYVSPGMRVMSSAMVGAAIFVLLIACTNVANLFLVQAAGRGAEISLRTALGASPKRVAWQLLSESLLVMLASGLLGIVLAFYGIRALLGLFPASNPIPYWMEFSLDPAVLLFAAAITVLAGLVAGLAPALDATKADLVTLLSNNDRSSTAKRGGLRSALVAAEVALSLVLLIGGALFVRSFLEVREVDSGFEEQGVTTLRLHLTGQTFDAPETRLRTVRSIVEGVGRLPGVDTASAAGLIPLGGGSAVSTAEIAGQESTEGRRPRTLWTPVTADYFDTLGVSLEQGRVLADHEVWEAQPLAVVNRKFVDRFLGEAPALEQRIRLENLDSPDDPLWLTVVGVVDDVKSRFLDRPAPPTVYVPYALRAGRTHGLVLRSQDGGPLELAAVRRKIHQVDAGIPLFDIATMGELRQRATWQFELVSRMFGLFGVLALVLAATGLYGVLAYSVSQQRREIGIRVALGAQRGEVIGHVMRQGLKLAGLGLAVGLVGAVVVAQILSSFLYGISTLDPVSFGGLSLFLAGIAVLATCLPAFRATRVDAIEVLRR